jgi:heparosan-N-sulfate-glucuronate 5-epimerase
MALRQTDYFKYLFLTYFLKKGSLSAGRSWRDPSVVDPDFMRYPAGQSPYPLDFSRDDTPNLLKDNEGIPMIDYANLGLHYNPWFVGHVALGCFTRMMREGQSKDRDRFIVFADWFVNKAVENQAGLYWLYNFDWFGHDAPWFSGLSQAHAISVLTRAASITGKAKYAETARKAVDCMIAAIGKGGTTTPERNGGVCFQESIYLPGTCILNGHLFSCFAVWDASRFFNDERYAGFTDAAFKFAEDNLEKYDLGYWSKYSLKTMAFSLPDIASSHYHDVHAAQLQAAFMITGCQTFMDYAKKFRAYQKDSSCLRKAIWTKRLTKLTA